MARTARFRCKPPVKTAWTLRWQIGADMDQPVPLAAVISTRPRPRITLVPAISIVNGWPGRALKASARTHKARFDPGNQVVAQAVGQRVTGNQQALAPAVRTALGHGGTCALTEKFYARTGDESIATERCIQVIKSHTR